ncbi:MAG: M23 family metallopeptidase [Eubacterium sp.]|nr:M23 family metallopeptidase [Eubacterium sp.]
MYRSPFKASSTQTTAFKKPGSWAAGYHTGVDRVCSNTALVSPANGTVQRNEYDQSYGNMVVITTTDGKSILMAHMKNKSTLKVGGTIKKGDAVGIMGNTGNSYGAPLHIEVQNSKTWAYNKNLLAPNSYIDWNDTTSTGSTSGSSGYPTPVKWQNGSTKESVYMQSNLTNEIGSLSAKEAAKCYGKSGSGYIVVYSLDGTSKHKAGFVKYAGGVTTVPKGGKTWTNGSTKETVYADTAKKTTVGSLSPKEKCTCLGKIDGMYLVLYKVDGTSNYKCGFVAYAGGC